MLYTDRSAAGRRLAGALGKYGAAARRGDVVVLALPRGGVPVAYEVARALGAPLDVFIVRKLGVPGHEELAMGAIATGGVRVINDEVVRALGIRPEMLDAVTTQNLEELERREVVYRDGRPAPDLVGRVVLLIDDGLATGSTMRAAAIAIRRFAPARLVIAVPVASADTCRELRRDADEVVCVATPEPFYGVGMWYRDFEQTTDEEVRALIASASRPAERVG